MSQQDKNLKQKKNYKKEFCNLLNNKKEDSVIIKKYSANFIQIIFAALKKPSNIFFIGQLRKL